MRASGFGGSRRTLLVLLIPVLLVTLEVSAFGASFRLWALCLSFTSSALASVLSFTPKSTSARPVWNFGKRQPKFFTEEALPGSISQGDVVRTRDKYQVRQKKVKVPSLTTLYTNEECQRRGNWVRTTCPESLRSRAWPGIELATS